MGAVLTPALQGAEKARDLPHACTLNGRCQEVCPVGIPLPALLRGWRDRSWKDGLVPQSVRSGLWLWRFAAERPRLYHLGTAAAVRAMRLFRRGGWIGRMPLAGAWTRYRDFPAPAARTFMEQLRDRERGR
jgi:L-lactate dehydrogenase complex protein LldF